MKTSKPFSTISFNSVPFLSKKLMELEKKRKIIFWCFIIHQPEDDEKKAHIHVYIEPNGKVDTDEFQDMFAEIDPNNSIPLNCLPFHSSKFEDWYMYEKHDPDYLVSKGQSRKYVYTDDDFVASDMTIFRDHIHSIDFSKLNGARIKLIRSYVEDKIPFYVMVAKGVVPIQQVKGWEITYKLIWDDVYGPVKQTQRGERGKTHE